jgi:hypothetical protein
MKTKNPNAHFAVQIDVVAIGDTNVICNLYTGTRCVKIAILKTDYTALCEDKFFLRKGDQPDSAKVLNTTCTYKTTDTYTS